MVILHFIVYDDKILHASETGSLTCRITSKHSGSVSKVRDLDQGDILIGKCNTLR